MFFVLFFTSFPCFLEQLWVPIVLSLVQTYIQSVVIWPFFCKKRTSGQIGTICCRAYCRVQASRPSIGRHLQENLALHRTTYFTLVQVQHINRCQLPFLTLMHLLVHYLLLFSLQVSLPTILQTLLAGVFFCALILWFLRNH